MVFAEFLPGDCRMMDGDLLSRKLISSGHQHEKGRKWFDSSVSTMKVLCRKQVGKTP